MPSPESIKQTLVAALFRIILNPNDLGVVGGARTDILISRIMKQALAVPNLALGHARDSLESELDSPEAAGAELGELLARRRDILIGALRDGRGLGGEIGRPGAEAKLAE